MSKLKIIISTVIFLMMGRAHVAKATVNSDDPKLQDALRVLADSGALYLSSNQCAQVHPDLLKKVRQSDFYRKGSSSLSIVCNEARYQQR
jgi:hypothetical protein